MYRYSVDNAVTYTPEDVVLFKESPFASFMERLTLENANHGIPPDLDSEAPRDTTQRQDEIADTLRTEDRNVSLIEWELDEPTRRTATLEAMRHGVDFIVNGQLALGSLSGAANLLMRTSGYSELGNFLYIPCDTQGKTTLQSAFRLCFLADLLHSLQGQLPPQMLIIRGGSDVVPLQTEDHIYHYQAVKQRFMTAQREFRKHRMPDPAESSHFGRWADCANEVMKQRLLSGQSEAVTDSESGDATADEQPQAMPLSQAVGSMLEPAQPGIAPALDQSADSSVSAEQVGTVMPAAGTPAAVSPAAGAPAAGSPATEQRYAKGIPVSDTLAAQARSLPPTISAESSTPVVQADTVGLAESEAVESTPEAGEASTAGDLASDRTTARAADAALMDLQFIGSSAGQRDADASLAPGGIDRRRARQEPPASALGGLHDSYAHVPAVPENAESAGQDALSGAEPAHPLDTPGFNVNQRSIVDRDELPPLATRSTPKSADDGDGEGREAAPPFSSSLITNDSFSTDK
ncbi:MAG: hypothetical protein ABJK20_00290 [Halieaceae bacterium]